MRALAQGPQFWEARQAGDRTPAYDVELAATFGPEGADEAHAEVKAEFKRLRALERKGV